MKTTSSTITLNEFYRGTSGTPVDVRLRIYLDTLNQPVIPANSTTVPSGGWTDTIPSSITTKLWMIIGNQTGGTGQYIWGNPVDVSPRSGVDGENGTNGSAGSRGNGFFTKSITLGVGVTTPIATSSEFNLDARETICLEMNGTWSTSCSLTIGEPVVGDVCSITYIDSNGDKDNTTGLYNGSVWEAFELTIDGSLLVDGTVVADSLASNLIVTNQIKGANKTNTNADSGLTGFFIDGAEGEMAVGDGTDDMRFIDGSLKIPATSLVSPDGTATPSNTAIYMKGDDANKFTLQVAGGKGFRCVPETISFTGHITEYLSASNTPAYSETVIPIAEITPNSLYAIKFEPAAGVSQDFNLTVFINDDYKAMMHWATCGSGSGWDGHWLEVYPVNSNTEVMFKMTAKHRGYNGGTIPEECYIPVNFKRVF